MDKDGKDIPMPDIMKEICEKYAGKDLKAPEIKPGDLVEFDLAKDNMYMKMVGEGTHIIDDVMTAIDKLNEKYSDNFGLALTITMNDRCGSMGKVHNITTQAGWVSVFGMLMCYLKDSMNVEQVKDFKEVLMKISMLL